MQAKFPGTCPMCLRPIAVGRFVDKLSERWVHTECMPEDPAGWKPPENWKFRGRRQMTGRRLLTRSKAVHERPHRYQ